MKGTIQCNTQCLLAKINIYLLLITMIYLYIFQKKMMILTRVTLQGLLYLFNTYYYYTIIQAELDLYTSRITARAVLSIVALSYSLAPEWETRVIHRSLSTTSVALPHVEVWYPLLTLYVIHTASVRTTLITIVILIRM